jgi:hypothetical protein
MLETPPHTSAYTRISRRRSRYTPVGGDRRSKAAVVPRTVPVRNKDQGLDARLPSRDGPNNSPRVAGEEAHQGASTSKIGSGVSTNHARVLGAVALRVAAAGSEVRGLERAVTGAAAALGKRRVARGCIRRGALRRVVRVLRRSREGRAPDRPDLLRVRAAGLVRVPARSASPSTCRVNLVLRPVFGGRERRQPS